MRLAAALLAVIYAYRACAHEDELVPVVLACTMAFVVLSIVCAQIHSERLAARADVREWWPVRVWLGGEVENDNAGSGRQAS